MTIFAVRPVFYWMPLLCGVLTFSAVWSVSPAHSFEAIDAENIIDACLNVSEEDRDSGVTARMRSGMGRSVKCLEIELVKQLQVLFPQDDPLRFPFPDGTSKSKIGIEKLLNEMRSSYEGLQWSIWNDHRGCKPACGTMYQLFSIGKYWDLVESILRDVVSVRNEYEF